MMPVQVRVRRLIRSDIDQLPLLHQRQGLLSGNEPVADAHDDALQQACGGGQVVPCIVFDRETEPVAQKLIVQ